MGSNKLKLNPEKTEFIVIGDDQIRSYLKSSFPVSFLGNIMEPAESVKNLVVILDADNSMQRHVARCEQYAQVESNAMVTKPKALSTYTIMITRFTYFSFRNCIFYYHRIYRYIILI